MLSCADASRATSRAWLEATDVERSVARRAAARRAPGDRAPARRQAGPACRSGRSCRGASGAHAVASDAKPRAAAGETQRPAPVVCCCCRYRCSWFSSSPRLRRRKPRQPHRLLDGVIEAGAAAQRSLPTAPTIARCAARCRRRRRDASSRSAVRRGRRRRAFRQQAVRPGPATGERTARRPGRRGRTQARVAARRRGRDGTPASFASRASARRADEIGFVVWPGTAACVPSTRSVAQRMRRHLSDRPAASELTEGSFTPRAGAKPVVPAGPIRDRRQRSIRADKTSRSAALTVDP